MIDRPAQALLAPLLAAVAARLHRAGLGADTVTLAGFAIGIAGCFAIAVQHYAIGLVLILVSRILDGVDGALARLTRPTDRGGYLDITLDFVFYAAVPLAFALADPARNALPAAVLIFTFVGTGTSFLAFAALAAKRRPTGGEHDPKSLHYLEGLIEAGETLAAFALFCLFPAAFPVLAFGFAALCALSAGLRIWMAARRLG